MAGLFLQSTLGRFMELATERGRMTDRANGGLQLERCVTVTKMFALTGRRPVSSVGRAPDCCAGGRRFQPRPDQHSGSLNN